MTYKDEMRKVVAEHRAEVEGELEQARPALSRSSEHVAELERQVERLEALLDWVVDVDAEMPESDRLTLHQAMKQVLEAAPQQRLRPADLAKEITQQGLYRMRDGRPVETQQIHARVGNYPRLFVRKGPFIGLADD